MSAPGLWAGLGESVFLANIGDRERSPAWLAGVIIGGAVVGAIAAICVACLVLIPYALSTGMGSEGIRGLGNATAALVSPSEWTLSKTIVFLLFTTTVDAAPLIAFVAFAATLAHRPFAVYATSAPRFRWRLLLMGLVLACIVLIPMVVAQRTLAGDPPPPLIAVAPDAVGRLAYGVSCLMLVPAAIAEELVFRGWLLRQTAAFGGRTGVMLLVSSMLFAAAHFGFNPALIEPDAFLLFAVMGVGFGYMTLRLGGIEFAAGAHSANNLLVALFLHPLSPQLPSQEGGPLQLVTDAALLGGYFIATEAVVRWPWLRRLGDVRPAEISPPDNLTTEFG